MTRTISERGLAILKGEERLELRAYLDGGGVWTIGYGHTEDVHEGQQITEHQAEVLLCADLAWAEKCVNLRAPTLNQNQFDACVSLVFNIGCPRFDSSTLLRMIRKGDIKSASAHFEDWVYDNGKFVQGLLNRRLKERALFDTPVPPDFSNVQSGVETTAPKEPT